MACRTPLLRLSMAGSAHARFDLALCLDLSLALTRISFLKKNRNGMSSSSPSEVPRLLPKCDRSPTPVLNPIVAQISCNCILYNTSSFASEVLFVRLDERQVMCRLYNTIRFISTPLFPVLYR